jgi:hypothetical protein
MPLGFLDFIPDVFFWVALAAWVLAAAGMVRSLVRQLGGTAGSLAHGPSS